MILIINEKACFFITRQYIIKLLNVFIMYKLFYKLESRNTNSHLLQVYLGAWVKI